MRTQIIEIKDHQNEINEIDLVDSHTEFIRFRSWGGSGLFSEFEFTLSNSQNSNFTIQIECREGDEEMIEKGLRNCISKLIERYNQLGFKILPFNLYLKNYRVHQIDTKPVCYEDPIRKRICELIDEEVKFKLKVNTNIRSSKANFITYKETTYHRHSEFAIMHRLPWSNDETLVLNDNWRFQIEIGGLDWHSEKSTIEVDIQNHFQPNKPNYIALEINNNIPHFIAVSINNEISKFIEKVYSLNYNPSGMKIKFRELTSWSGKYAEERIFNSLRVSLRELISSKENYELKETKPVDNK
jgi:hypothetical protein